MKCFYTFFFDKEQNKIKIGLFCIFYSKEKRKKKKKEKKKKRKEKKIPLELKFG